MARGVTFKWANGCGRTLVRLSGAEDQSGTLARSCASMANGSLSPGGYEYEDFEVVEMDGGGYVVRTKTDHARYSQAKNKTLTKAFKSMRAG